MRYVIKSPNGYFTEFKVLRSRAVTLNGVMVGIENDCEPKFESMIPQLAAKFDTEADALAQIDNAALLFHGGPEAFAGCVVEATTT